MNIKTIKHNTTMIAVIHSHEILISDVQSALDLMATVKYETGCSKIVINKEALIEDFFKLSTCLAGEILQKFINYNIKFAIVGDYSMYSSKSLKDFIYECNHCKDIFFVPTEDDAMEKLSTV